MRAAFIDLDGVVNKNTVRWDFATSEKDMYRKMLTDFLRGELVRPENGAAIQRSLDGLLESLFWQSVFTSEMVETDILIEGANEALLQLRQEGYRLVFLTSRPEAMRAATRAWLDEYTIYDERNGDMLIMKPAAYQMTKTATWKAGTIDHEMRSRHSVYERDQVLFIDDDKANREELLKYLDTNAYTINVYESLHDAVTRDVIGSEETTHESH